MDNAVAYGDGKVYSIAGFNGLANVADGFVYDPSAQAWTAIADAPAPLESPAGAFVDGQVYIVGGWDEAGNASSGVYAYDPSSDSWSQKADLPEDISAASAAVLDGQLYVVGGCTTGDCAPTSTRCTATTPPATAGPPSRTTRRRWRSPPAPASAGEVVCAGGVNADTNASTAHAYAYDPGSDSWTQVADLPADLWAAAVERCRRQAAGVQRRRRQRRSR